jgi:hypothetical protein
MTRLNTPIRFRAVLTAGVFALGAVQPASAHHSGGTDFGPQMDNSARFAPAESERMILAQNSWEGRPKYWRPFKRKSEPKHQPPVKPITSEDILPSAKVQVRDHRTPGPTYEQKAKNGVTVQDNRTNQPTVRDNRTADPSTAPGGVVVSSKERTKKSTAKQNLPGGGTSY